MTSLISLDCGFPLEADLGSSLLFTISELRPLRHQKASTAFMTAHRVPGGGVWLLGGSLPDGAGIIIPPWLEDPSDHVSIMWRVSIYMGRISGMQK